MATGDLRPPVQFGGLIARSSDDFATPWEMVEITRFDDPSEVETPLPSAWLLALEDWQSLNDRERVWHYMSRADPLPFGQQVFKYYQTVETGLGDYLHYKPHPYYVHRGSYVDLMFRRIPPALLLNLDMEETEEKVIVKVMAMSGSILQQMEYDKDFRITWKSFQQELRDKMVHGGQISVARDFKLLTQTGHGKAMNALLFKPKHTEPYLLAHQNMMKYKSPKNKGGTHMSSAKAKASPKANVLKKPAAAKTANVLKKPAAAKTAKVLKKPAAAKAAKVLKKPASVKGGMAMKKAAAGEALSRPAPSSL